MIDIDMFDCFLVELILTRNLFYVEFFIIELIFTHSLLTSG